NFHGQPEARLDANQSVYESSEHRTRKSIILRIVDFLFFNMPSAYPVEINRIWVDGLVNMPRWRAFITTTTTKWANWTLCSTVMLAVDVSLLTVPGVDPTTTDFQPINVIAIYISVMCTLCSLCSLVWMSVIGISLRSSSDEVAEHITWLTSSPLGIDYMAIVYSVPFGLMWWGYVLDRFLMFE
ncbi:hypothetical protein J3A83DRAFT_4093017, partial [Scleroderma citrinum]